MNLPFFAVKAYVPGGVQNQAEKKKKNAFRPVPVQKFTFPESVIIERGNKRIKMVSSDPCPRYVDKIMPCKWEVFFIHMGHVCHAIGGICNILDQFQTQ